MYTPPLISVEKEGEREREIDWLITFIKPLISLKPIST